MTDADELNSDPDQNKALATGIVTTIQQIQTSFTGFAVELAKWIITSLLAINGAGVLAVWPSDILLGYKVVSCIIFLVGMISAMLSGYLALTYLARIAKPLGETIGYWITVQADGIRDESLEDFGMIAAHDRHTWPSTLTGWLAAILFVIGAAVAGWADFAQIQSEKAQSVPNQASSIRERGA